jgi:hypothetical protein
MFDIKLWESIEPHIKDLPGGVTLCEQVRKGSSPWMEIAYAMYNCTMFPANEFLLLLESDDFNIRWPLTFAAWYWLASGASVDQPCADFLTYISLWEQALAILPEYSSSDILSKWRSNFEQYRPVKLS